MSDQAQSTSTLNTGQSPPTQSPTPNGPVLSRPGESELCSWVEALYDEAAKARQELAHDDQWDDWWEGFWGDQMPGNLPSYKPPVICNELQTLLLAETSDLTDAKLGVFVQKSNDRDKNAEKAIQSYWQRNFVDMQIMTAALDGMIFPSGFLSVVWDMTKMQGQGDLVVRARDPRSVYPDPDCEDDETWRYVITRDVMDVVEIRQLWPDQGWRVKPEGAYSLRLADQSPSHMRSSSYKGPLYAPGSGLIADGFAKARATVLTMFIYDDQLEEELEDITNPETGERSLKSTIRQKYPHGRMVVTANGVVLFDGPSPYHDRFPIVRVPMVPSPHTFWPPFSPLSGVLSIQQASNKMESIVVENGLRLNGGMLVADANSGINPETFQNIPGQAILKTPGTEVRITYPPPMPPDMVQSGERLRGIMRTILGFTTSRIGMGQRGNVSAELSETEISQSMSLSRLRGRLLYHAVQQTTEMIFARMAQFYTTPRHLPFIGAGGEWELVPWNPIPDPKAYSVHVDPASFQVRSRTMLQRLALALGKMNKIPIEDMLTLLDVPNAKEMAAKVLQELQLAAAAKAKK